MLQSNNLFKLACIAYCFASLTGPSLFAQINDIVGTGFEPSSDGVVIGFQGGNKPAEQLQLTFQRYNEYDDPVGAPISKPVTVEAGKLSRTMVNGDDLRGAAAVRYWLTNTATTPEQSTVPVKIDLAALRKPDNLKKEYDDFRQKSESNLQRAKTEYAAALAAKDTDISTLKDQLVSLGKDVVAKFLPTSLSLYREPEIFPTKVGFYVRTNKAGLIAVSAFKDSDAKEPIAVVRSTNLLAEHNISFDKDLAPGTTYYFKVSVLNFDGTPYPSGAELSYKEDTRLKIQMPVAVPAPNFIMEPPELVDGKLRVKVTPSSDVLLSGELREEQGVNYVPLKRAGITVQTTTFGRPTNPDRDYTNHSTVSPFDFDGLKPETKYTVEITATDNLGQVTKQTYPKPIETPKRTPDFDFTGSIELNISAVGFTAIWEATTKPKSGSFSVVFKDGGPITSQPATIDGNKLTATLGADALKQFYAKAKGNAQPKAEDKPTLKFTMAKEGNAAPKEATIKIVYSVPTEAQVNDAVKQGILTSDNKKEILDVVKSYQENGKIEWKKLLSTGIGIVMSVL